MASFSCLAQAPKTAPSFKMEVNELAPDNQKINEAFEALKGKIPLPLDNGKIIIGINTPGIELGAENHAKVHTVFEGEVTSVMQAEGKKIVIVRHGNYFTVYNKLDYVSVTKGQHVEAYAPLGTVADGDHQKATLNFQLWKGSKNEATTKLDPKEWLIGLRK